MLDIEIERALNSNYFKFFSELAYSLFNTSIYALSVLNLVLSTLSWFGVVL